MTELHKGRVKTVLLLETAVNALYDTFVAEKDPEIKKACLNEAGQIHGVAERLNNVWRTKGVSGENAER